MPGSTVSASRRLLLAEVLLAQDRVDEAQAELDQAQATWASASEGLAPAAAMDLELQRLQAAMQLRRGDPAGALTLLDAMPRSRNLAPDAPDQGEVDRQLLRSASLLRLGQPEAALAAAQGAQAQLRLLAPPLRWPRQEADTALALGLAWRANGQRREANAALRSALALRQAHDLPSSLWVAHAQAALGATANLEPIKGLRGNTADTAR